MADEHRDLLTTLTVDIVSAFVANNSVRGEDVPGLIASTHAALTALDGAAASDTAVPEHVGAVTARKSLADRDHIISMIDGKPYRSLKRHLGTHGLTPDDYRARYKLPASYPMVAPGYSEARRAVAKKLGLGRKPRGTDTRADAGAVASADNPAFGPVPGAQIAAGDAAPRGPSPKSGRRASADVVRPARKPRVATSAKAEPASASPPSQAPRKPRAKLGIVTE